jgi:hypothetical protein
MPRVERLARGLRALDEAELARVEDALDALERVTLEVLRGPR